MTRNSVETGAQFVWHISLSSKCSFRSSMHSMPFWIKLRACPLAERQNAWQLGCLFARSIVICLNFFYFPFVYSARPFHRVYVDILNAQIKVFLFQKEFQSKGKKIKHKSMDSTSICCDLSKWHRFPIHNFKQKFNWISPTLFRFSHQKQFDYHSIFASNAKIKL